MNAKKFLRFSLLIGLMVGTGGPIFAAAPSVAARHIKSSITIDGKLDNPEWRSAPVITLTQQAPNPGGVTTYKTEVRVLMSSDAIYFGFACHDPKPASIAMHTMLRDGDQSGDDTVAT